MKNILKGMIALFIATSLYAVEGTKMTVYKSPYCGCCTKWVDIMKAKGFDVDVKMVDNVNAVNKKLQIDPKLSSCHTAIVDNYVVIGHVDYSAVKKMLDEKPNIKGITVPGMPIGSPGMEQGNMKQSYNVLSINGDNSVGIFEKH
ncbi:MAG: DUF411 domain-containing protein [Sulfurovum sp.]|jgi:hypothetical protein|nr:MAG: Uncharacterised protein [Arcobacter lacus]